MNLLNNKKTIKRLGLGAGIERIGYLAIARPKRWVILILTISALALLGSSRVRVDDSLTELFKTASPEFRTYEKLTQHFPSSEYDVQVVFEHPDLLTPEHLDLMRNVALELDFVRANKGTLSIFSAREPPGNQTVPPPLIPLDIPQGKAFKKLKEKILTNRVVGGKLISEDGSLALMIVELDRQIVEKEGLDKVVAEIRGILGDELQGSDLSAELTGPPIMQLEIRNAVRVDRALYNGLGFLLGTFVCFIFFRKLSLTLITIAAPAMAVLWSLGALGLMGYRLNLFLNVIIPLIMVISFSDSMHMMFAIRRSLIKGIDRFQAVRLAIREVGPACVLTSATTAIALASLIFASSALIRTFGIVTAISSVVSFLAVITLVPVLAILLLPDQPGFADDLRKHSGPLHWLGRASGRLGLNVRRNRFLYAILGYGLTLAFGSAYLSLEPRYRLADQVPDREQALSASKLLDAKLNGSIPVYIMIEIGGERTLYSRETLGLIADAQKLMENSAGVGNVWSLEVLRRWLVEKGETEPEALKKYVDLMPETLVRRFISTDQRIVLVTGRMPDIDASRLLPLIKDLDQQLKLLQISNPDYKISVTGLPAIAATSGRLMIGELGFGLMSTIAVVVALIAIAFRSFFAALASIIPNLFPIFVAGGVLFVSGAGLQFSSAVALTVAFGLAVDDTIHFLHRWQYEKANGHSFPIARTVRLIGPVLILTTVVLVLGLAVTAFSGLPSLRMFGWLSAVTLLAALFGDIILLPAILYLERYISADDEGIPHDLESDVSGESG